MKRLAPAVLACLMATVSVAQGQPLPEANVAEEAAAPLPMKFRDLAKFVRDPADPAQLETALAALDALVQEGDANAAMLLAREYARASGAVGQDYSKAVQYYEAAAALGKTEVYATLAGLHRRGVGGLPQDKAIDYYVLAADTGDIEAMRTAADIYLKGNGAESDPDLAETYLRKAMEAGDSTARDALATALMRGNLGADRAGEGLDLLEAALEEGDASRVATLAKAYFRGNGVEANPEKARDLLVRGAEMGDPSARTDLVDLYVFGFGQAIAPDLEAGRTLFEQIPADQRSGVAASGALLAAHDRDYPEMWDMFRTLDGKGQSSVGLAIFNADKNAYVYVLQGLASERGHYSGSMNGQLTSSTIVGVNALCAELGISEVCRIGPLARTTWRAIGTKLAS